MKTVDNRGLNCPEPLLRTRQALQETSELISLVDNETARENILRYARNQGLTATWETKDNCYVITITGSAGPATLKDNAAEAEPDLQCRPQPGRLTDTVIMISENRFGRGDEQLGELLIRNFIFTLTKREPLPSTIILVNSGVKLSVSGSPVLEELQQLAGQGVKILSCGTCLDYYKLTGKLAIGEVTNMYDLTDIITAAARTISL